MRRTRNGKPAAGLPASDTFRLNQTVFTPGGLMRRLTALALFVAFAAPEAAAKTIAPFLDEQTFFIGHADLSRIEFDKALALFKELGKFEDKELEKPAAEVKGWLEAFKKAGGKDVYLVVSMADLPSD